ncbi:hypothetical protein GDO81_003945 [Engystomops pustulosus]|uniref:Uncharacterized protein n=1 Tax=Engystomops pustulosus TaxID=76066 RepID=A0AAV7A7M0_ENGPU|nr:hypothetical protein GDO81_003945 [Engystomops pustulosus]
MLTCRHLEGFCPYLKMASQQRLAPGRDGHNMKSLVLGLWLVPGGCQNICPFSRLWAEVLQVKEKPTRDVSIWSFKCTIQAVEEQR